MSIEVSVCNEREREREREREDTAGGWQRKGQRMRERERVSIPKISKKEFYMYSTRVLQKKEANSDMSTATIDLKNLTLATNTSVGRWWIS